MTDRINFDLKGTKALERAIIKYGKRGKRAVAGGLYAAGSVIIKESKRRTPVLDGTLRGSGYVTEPQNIGRGVLVEIGHGGAASAYAVRQHEDLTLNHPGGGEAKFLENAMVSKKGEAFRTAAATANAIFERDQRQPTIQEPNHPDKGTRET